MGAGAGWGVCRTALRTARGVVAGHFETLVDVLRDSSVRDEDSSIWNEAVALITEHLSEPAVVDALAR